MVSKNEQEQSEAAEIAEQRRQISLQLETISELETPVIEVWENVLALPIIGTLDTQRAQTMTEKLLQRIVETKSEIVILDITGVPVVDTSVARHLLDTVAAARLLGAEVLVVGLTARTAMTLVHLGLDLSSVATRTTMAKGLELAFGRLGLRVVRSGDGEQRGG